MRSLISITASVAMLVAQVPLVPAFAQNAPSVPQATSESAIIGATFRAFPSGGDPLSMRFADLITANPKLAMQLVIYMRNNAQGLSSAQKVAAERGLAAAADRLGIEAAVRCSDGSVSDAGCVDDLWIALAILAVGGGAAGIAMATNHHNNQIQVPVVPVISGAK